jgi:hypothetical protein
VAGCCSANGKQEHSDRVRPRQRSIGSGFIASLARPGGNLTGLAYLEAGIAGKWLAMLKEIAPRLSRALRDAQSMADSLAVKLVPCLVEDAAGIERAIESFAHGHFHFGKGRSRIHTPT